MKDSGLLLFDLTRCLQPQMVPGKFRCHSSARSAVDKSGFDQERLVDILDGSGVLSDGSSQGVKSHRASLELLYDRHQDIPVILSIGGNFPLIWKKDRLPLYRKTGDGVYIKSSSTRAHYVTVTGIEHGWLRISSWGQEWYINWREYRNFAWIKSCPLFSNICYITRKH